MSIITAGFDIGGAHLKVALVQDGRPIAVEQFYCPLWQGMEKLDMAFAQARPLIVRADRHAVTMTGELSDLFADRHHGVLTLVDKVQTFLGQEVLFWLGEKGLASADAARRHTADVASTNFLATASVMGLRLRDALLIDMGSTTTDIIPIKDGRPVPRGLTDADRLETGELVYTGLTRTAVMAVANEAPFRGRRQRLCREHFATMADVHRILGHLPEGLDQHATADGRGKSIEESLARFARMLGRDRAEGELAEWLEAARYVAEQQLASMLDGANQVLSAARLPPSASVVAAGIGASVVEVLAQRLGLQCEAFGELVDGAGDVALWSTRCAPAVAVALLAA